MARKRAENTADYTRSTIIDSVQKTHQPEALSGIKSHRWQQLRLHFAGVGSHQFKRWNAFCGRFKACYSVLIRKDVYDIQELDQVSHAQPSKIPTRLPTPNAIESPSGKSCTLPHLLFHGIHTFTSRSTPPLATTHRMPLTFPVLSLLPFG
jgi:hypothetical protein